MNPLYEQLARGQQVPNMAPNNPISRANAVMQAMQNPAEFVKKAFPDIPDNISNNPAQILNYIQRTRGISNQQIQGLIRMFGG